MSPLEVFAVVASAVGVWLTTRRKVLSWPVILLACGLYALVFQRAKLYSDMLLQGVYAAFAVYGWWHWRRSIAAEGSVTVERLRWQGRVAGLLAGALGSVALGMAMRRYTDAAVPYVDSALTSFSLVAQGWSARKHVANWPLWIAIDTVYAGVFVYKRLYLTAGLYGFFVFLAILGWRAWGAALAAQEKPVGTALAVE